MKKLSILILSVFIFLSCSNDDNQDNFLSYYLETYTPSAILPEPQSYDASEIIWKFDFEAQTVIVINNTNNFVLFEEGTHSYTLEDHACGYENNKAMMIGETYLGILVEDGLGDGSVILTDACLDGHVAIFQPIQIL